MKKIKTNPQWTAIAEVVEEIQDDFLYGIHQQMLHSESPEHYCELTEQLYFANEQFNLFAQFCELVTVDPVERNNYQMVEVLKKLNVEQLHQHIASTGVELSEYATVMYFAIYQHLAKLQRIKQYVLHTASDNVNNTKLLTA